MASNRFPLTLLAESFAVCKLGPDDEAPIWILDLEGPLACVMRTEDELCVVCAEEDVPDSAVQVERGWRAFKLEGPVPFTTVGVVSSLTAPLAEAGIGVFILSTYDTDYLLVKGEVAGRAQKVLGRAGFVVASQAAP